MRRPPGSPERPPLWPVVEVERPWALPGAFWNFATPWAWVRIYGHVAENVLYALWWWSRGPLWWITDRAYGLDWRIQAAVKAAHEARVRRTNERRRR